MKENVVSLIGVDELKGIDLGKDVVRLKLERFAVPWVILAAHVLLGFTTDALEIVTSLVETFHIHGIPESMVEQVVAWSLYSMGLDYTVVLHDSKTRHDQLKYAAANASRLSEKRTEIWREIFDHLHEQKAFAHPKVEAGVVYFALFRLPENASRGLYTVLFLDAATGALAFTSPFQREQEGLGAISRYIRKHIDVFLREHGQPAFMVCVNPWDSGEKYASLVGVLQDAVKGLPPLSTHFCIYTTRDGDIFCDLPSTLANLLLHITERLESGLQRLKVDPILSFYTEKGSTACWEYILESSFGDLLQRKFHTNQPVSYYLGNNGMNPTPCRLSYAVPGKGATISLTGQHSWDRLYVSPYLDVDGGDMTVQHEAVEHLDECDQDELDRLLTLSANYFLHDVSSESNVVGLQKPWHQLLLYIWRVAETPKTSLESTLVRTTPVETIPVDVVDRQLVLNDGPKGEPKGKAFDPTASSKKPPSPARTPAGTPVYSADAAVAMMLGLKSRMKRRERAPWGQCGIKKDATAKDRASPWTTKALDGKKFLTAQRVSHEQRVAYGNMSSGENENAHGNRMLSRRVEAAVSETSSSAPKHSQKVSLTVADTKSPSFNATSTGKDRKRQDQAIGHKRCSVAAFKDKGSILGGKLAQPRPVPKKTFRVPLAHNTPDIKPSTPASRVRRLSVLEALSERALVQKSADDPASHTTEMPACHLAIKKPVSYAAATNSVTVASFKRSVDMALKKSVHNTLPGMPEDFQKSTSPNQRRPRTGSPR